MINLALPDDRFDYGLTPAVMGIRADPELDAVVMQVPEADLDLVMGIPAAIDLVLKLTASIERLQTKGDGE